jgi:hypothetical protein
MPRPTHDTTHFVDTHFVDMLGRLPLSSRKLEFYLTGDPSR